MMLAENNWKNESVIYLIFCIFIIFYKKENMAESIAFLNAIRIVRIYCVVTLQFFEGKEILQYKNIRSRDFRICWRLALENTSMPGNRVVMGSMHTGMEEGEGLTHDMSALASFSRGARRAAWG